MNYKEDYHNNHLNWLLSNNTDGKRSIMDIDGFITKIGQTYGFMIDHKNNTDIVSINTLRQLSKFSYLTLKDNTIIKCFIVRCNINEKENKITDHVTIYEIKSYNKVKDKKEKSDFIENRYTLFNTIELIDFLSPEKHNKIIEQIKDRL
jgi:hypothetical protein